MYLATCYEPKLFYDESDTAQSLKANGNPYAQNTDTRQLPEQKRLLINEVVTRFLGYSSKKL